MAIPTWEQYRAEHPEAQWGEYAARFSAMAARRQVERGELPEEYYKTHTFTSSGVWVPSGSMASIGGLPGEIKDIFPGVEKQMQEARELAEKGRVITSSTVAEPQLSFSPPPTPPTTTPMPSWTQTGGQAPVQFDEPLTQTRSFVPPPIPIRPWEPQVNGQPAGNGDMGILPLLFLGAMLLGGM